MNSSTITMERESALAKLEQYEQAATARPGKVRNEDRAIMRGYRVLAKGGRLLDVNEAIRHGGLNLAGLPKLAIARAHVERSKWWAETTGRYVNEADPANLAYRIFATGGGEYLYGPTNGRVTDDRRRWRLPAETFAADRAQHGRTFEALTPLIPLPHRPRHNLSNYFLLWEANWHALPVDPYLLRPITGSLMEILAEWDVSPVELAAVRSAMRTR